MGENIGSVSVEVNASIDKLKNKFDEAVKDSKTTASKIESAFSKVGSAIAAAGGAYAAFSFLRDSVKESQDASQALAKVEQNIKTTGGAAGYTAGQLQEMVNELENMAGIDGDKILNDVTLQLMTFTNITGESFKRAQQAVLDLSAVLGSDLIGQSIQLGKALEDPVRGLTALQRVGITFTSQQKNMIKDYIKHNDLLSAQGVILTEIETKYGGQAKVMNDASGGVMSLNVAWGNFKEKIGNTILPVISALAGEMKNLTDKTKETSEVWIVLGYSVKVVGGFFSAILSLLQMVGTALGTIGAAVYATVTGKFSQAASILEMGMKKISDTYASYEKTIDKMFGSSDAKKPDQKISPKKPTIGGGELSEEEIKKQKQLHEQFYNELDKTSSDYYTGQIKLIKDKTKEFIDSGIKEVNANKWKTEQIKKLDKEVNDAKMEQYKKEFTDKYVANRLKASGGIESVGSYGNIKDITGRPMEGIDENTLNNYKLQTNANLKEALKTKKELTEGQKFAIELGQNFASILSSGFSSAISQGKSLSEVFQNLGRDLMGMVFQALLFKGIMAGLNFISGGLGLGNLFGAAASSSSDGSSGVISALGQVNNSVQALSMNLIKGGNKGTINITLDGQQLVKSVNSYQNRLVRNGVDLNVY